MEEAISQSLDEHDPGSQRNDVEHVEWLDTGYSIGEEHCFYTCVRHIANILEADNKHEVLPGRLSSMGTSIRVILKDTSATP